MKKLHITNVTSKEKELALSLLRIPLNFFAEDKSQVKKSASGQEEIKINTDSHTYSKGTKIKLDANNKNAHVDIELEVQPTKSVNSSSPKSSSTSESSKSQTDTTDANLENDTPSPTNSSSEISSDATDNSTKSGTTEPEKPPASRTPNQQIKNEANQQQSNSSNPTVPKKQTQPTSNEKSDTEQSTGNKPNSETTPKNDAEQSTDNKPNSETNPKDDTNSQPTETGKKAENDNNASPTSDKKENPSSDKKKDDEARRLKGRFGKKIPGSDNAKKLKDDAKKKLADKVAKSPVASKALGAASKASGSIPGVLDDANKIKDAIKDGNTDKMQEAVGDLAVKAAAAGGNAVLPGAGTAINAVDKVVGQTEVGKKAKKAIGCCCCSSCGLGCIIPILIILIPVVFISQAFSWITNLFGWKDKTEIYGEEASITDSEYECVQQISTQYSMQSYTDDVKKLSNPSLLTWLIGNNSDSPIQDASEKYINEYRYHTQDTIKALKDIARSYNISDSRYQELIDKGYIIDVEEGDLTSFGMAFEILKGNYSVFKLKAHASAPKRIKMIDRDNDPSTPDEKVIYTTYDPKGIHTALFQDVLTNIDGPNGLKARFNGQIDNSWFDELNIMLDKKFQVYVPEVNRIEELSLRDLFIETSEEPYDTKYYANLVNIILTSYTDTNKEIIAQYNTLVDKLAMLELMTYMLAYQKYYSQINIFISENSGYANIDMFKDPEFWGQFLTFSNVEYYLALSSLTDPSLTYEIAVASINTSLNAIDVSKIYKGNKTFIGINRFENWYATYYFTPQITANDNGYTYTMSDPTVETTQIQNQLFDKYNVGFGLYDYDTDSNLSAEDKALRNQNAFFAIFETATGIKMSQMDDNGNLQTPIYELDKKGISKSRTFPIDTSNNLQARITNGYGQLYSDSTVARFGLSHSDHTGIDYGVPSGTTVMAADSGTAYITRGNTGYGNYVKIIHDDGYTSIYAHGNGTFYISNGSRVVSGQPIMQSGNSGNSTGPHLHFEVRTPSGSTINPTSYIYGNA